MLYWSIRYAFFATFRKIRSHFPLNRVHLLHKMVEKVTPDVMSNHLLPPPQPQFVYIIVAALYIIYYLFPSNDPPLLAPSGPPTSLLAKTGARNLTLSWSPPAPPDRNEAIASYKVDCTSSGVPSSSGETAELSLVVSSLVPFTVYNCCVLASNAVGTGPSSCQLFRTKEAGE